MFFFFLWLTHYTLNYVWKKNPFRAKSKEEQVDIFFRQGDFGYIRERREELITLCASNKKVDIILLYIYWNYYLIQLYHAAECLF